MSFSKITASDYRLAADLHVMDARHLFRRMISDMIRTGLRTKSSCVGTMHQSLTRAKLYGLRAKRLEIMEGLSHD